MLGGKMGESQGKQLTDILHTLLTTPNDDVYKGVATKIDSSCDLVEQQLATALENDHPYISDISQQLAVNLTPYLQAALLSAAQQALEKGHQAAMVQHQSEEDEQLHILQVELDELKKQQQKWLQKNETLQADLKQQTAHYTELSEQLDEQKKRAERLEQENQHHAEQAQNTSTLADERTQLAEKLTHAEALLEKQKEHNEAQSTKLKQLIEERRLLNQEQEAQNIKKSAAFSDEIDSLKEQLLAKKIAYEELETQSQEKITHLEQSTDSLQQKLKQISASSGKNESKLTALESDLEQANITRQELAKSHEQQVITLTKVEEQNKQLNLDIEKLRQENLLFKEQLDENAQAQEGRFNDLKKGFSNETQELKLQLEDKVAQIAELEAQTKTLENAKLASEQNNEASQDLVKRLQKQLEQQDSALNLEQGRNTSLLSRLEKDSQQARGAYESVRNENLTLNERIEELEAKVTEFKLKFEYAQKQITQ